MNIEVLLNENNLNGAVIINTETIHSKSLPDSWKEIIKLGDDRDEKRKVILKYWTPIKEKLPKIYSILINDLIDLYIIDHDKKQKLLYIFQSNEEIITYQGELPIHDNPFYEKMPKEIALFYKEIHNGWNDTINGGSGFVSLSDIKYLDQFEWGILDEIETPSIDLSKTYYVFQNGAGGYICINDVESKFEYLIWWSDDKPQYKINFWSYFDAWVQINFGYEYL